MYKIKFDNDDFEEYEDEEFETREEAMNCVAQIESECRAGAEELNMSNPGDYPYDEDDDFEIDYEIIKI